MINKENYEEYMLLYADGELSEAEVKALMAFVDAHPELRGELEAYGATRLVPDTTVVYEQKEQLLKTPPKGRIIGLNNRWMYAAVAAGLALLVVTIVKQQDSTPQPVAQNNTNIITDTNHNTPIAKTTNTPVDDTAIEIIHSKPANPVIHENNIAKEVRKTKPGTRKTNTKVPVINKPSMQKEDVYIAKDEPKKTEVRTNPAPVQKEQEAPVLVAQNDKEDNPRVQNTTKNQNPVAEEDDGNNESGMLAWLPIGKKKKQTETALAETINEKLEKVKEVKNNLKNTDLRFRIGNKELFTVRL